MEATRRIDVHHHITPAIYREAMFKYGIDYSGIKSLNEWTPEASLAQMDALGTETGICSISEPALYPIVAKNKKEAKELARSINEYMAEMSIKYPGRFGAFALLPMPDVEASLEEIAYALDILHLDGVGLLSNYQEEYLGNKIFEPIFQELQKRRACIYVHPSASPSALVRPEFVTNDGLAELCFNTTRAATNLILSGTMDRCPDIKVIFSHMGGTLPYLGWRMDNFIDALKNDEKLAFMPEGVWSTIKSLTKSVPEYMSMFYYDTALATHKAAFQAVETSAPGHTLFGSDAFYAPLISCGKVFVHNIDSYFTDKQELYAVNRGNAEIIFPRFRK